MKILTKINDSEFRAESGERIMKLNDNTYYVSNDTTFKNDKEAHQELSPITTAIALLAAVGGTLLMLL
jgi:hypothetical protein